MAPVQVADKTWEYLREEGAIIEETLEDDCDHGTLSEKVDENATSHGDAVASTSFNEKSDRLHEYQMDIVDVHPDEHPPGNEDGQGLL